jgi:pimeloyl-ACP methyl ester carboxylesterase
VIHGEADLGAPFELCGRRTNVLIPGSKLITYADAAHGLFLTHRGRFNEDLLEWVKE